MKESRKIRTQKYRDKIKDEWSEIFLKNILNYFSLEYINYLNLSENINITWKSIEKHPNLPWKTDGLSNNPNINYTQVLKNSHLNWNYRILSLNPAITWDDILRYPNEKWDWRNLSDKPNIPLHIIPEKFDQFNLKLLMHNPSVTSQYIEENSYLPWDYHELPFKDDLDFSNLFRLVEKFKIKLAPNHWIVISEKEYINWNIVSENMELPWNFTSLSRNPNISLQIILENPQFDWSFKNYSYNPKCVIQEVLDNPNLNWDWEHISENLVTPSIYQNNRDIPFCKLCIQMNPSFSFDEIWRDLSIKPNMNNISWNPNIKFLDIIKNKGLNWDWHWLSGHDFNADREEYLFCEKRKWMASYTIQQFYWTHRLSPHYKFGRKKINQMYDEINS